MNYIKQSVNNITHYLNYITISMNNITIVKKYNYCDTIQPPLQSLRK